MSIRLDGSTRVHFIVGDPIAQVKSPAGVTEAYQQLGRNAVVVPAHVAPADLSIWVSGISRARNCDGIIVTVPHKFACFDLCATGSERASFLRTANVMRRNPDGSWHGDMFDGLGFVAALRDKGCEPEGRQVLLVGAGGAGSAIAHALVLAGVSRLAVHDKDEGRCSALVGQLGARVERGSADPTGFDLVINASPMGMQAADPMPLQAGKLTGRMFVACVVTAPAITPLIAAAQALGCGTVTGAEMFDKVRDLMVGFLLEA